MNQERLLIIGHGMAATRLLQQLTEGGYGGSITVIGDEGGVGYNRIQLTPWLAGEVSEASLNLVDDAWYRHHRIYRVNGDAVASLDPDGLVTLSTGRTLAFDTAVLATGALPRFPDLPFPPQPAIRAFRSKADGHWLKALPRGQSVVVIGGGLLGLEAAWGLRARGHSVSLVHRNGHLMNRQLSAPTAALLAGAMSQAGITIHLGCELRRINANPVIESVELTNGEILNARVLIAAAGIQPNQHLAQQAGLGVHRGVLIDDQMRTSHPRVFALGECAEFNGETFGLVAPAYEQADVLASVLCGRPAHWSPLQSTTRLKISGLDVVSHGRIDHPDARHLTLNAPGRNQCRRLHFLNDRLIGAEMIGLRSHLELYQRLIEQQTPINDARAVMLGNMKAA
ncbi:NAD(P)/FAD-dependent oxidoreductase [Saccharospirillum impatiens]|uniref:NAD(P)/FAD-dependent oxidoreductase n=1 Tax=Saccharospirillum impatiens TaxID=169438 RepID=UPI0004118263|nr:FAD-dependent oxidoreductase [Saccharospirillum impatiens]